MGRGGIVARIMNPLFSAELLRLFAENVTPGEFCKAVMKIDLTTFVVSRKSKSQ